MKFYTKLINYLKLILLVILITTTFSSCHLKERRTEKTQDNLNIFTIADTCFGVDSVIIMYDDFEIEKIKYGISFSIEYFFSNPKSDLDTKSLQNEQLYVKKTKFLNNDIKIHYDSTLSSNLKKVMVYRLNYSPDIRDNYSYSLLDCSSDYYSCLNGLYFTINHEDVYTKINGEGYCIDKHSWFKIIKYNSTLGPVEYL